MDTRDILVAVIGLDQPGVVAATAETLTRLQCNIEEMSQTTLRGQFSSIFLVNKPADLENVNIHEELRLAYEGRKYHLGIAIRDFCESAPAEAADNEPFVVSVWGPDRNDIIACIARVLAEQGINIDSLRAFRIENNQSLQVFEVSVPVSVDMRGLRRLLSERAGALGLRVNLQHAAIFEAIHRVRVD